MQILRCAELLAVLACRVCALCKTVSQVFICGSVCVFI